MSESSRRILERFLAQVFSSASIIGAISNFERYAFWRSAINLRLCVGFCFYFLCFCCFGEQKSSFFANFGLKRHRMHLSGQMQIRKPKRYGQKIKNKKHYYSCSVRFTNELALRVINYLLRQGFSSAHTFFMNIIATAFSP